MKSLLPTLLFCLLFVGCQSSNTYDGEKQKASAQIDIFRDGAKPQVKYREIGMIADDGRKEEQPGIEGKMIKKAKGMGGNAIIFLPLEQSGEELRPFFAGLATAYVYKALVVVYE